MSDKKMHWKVTIGDQTYRIPKDQEHQIEAGGNTFIVHGAMEPGVYQMHVPDGGDAVAAVLMTAGGAVLGRVVIAVSGMVAAGMVGGGAGIGMAAGPVGAFIGGLVGLALFGVIQAVTGDSGRTITVTIEDADPEIGS
jgi:hypothetical protein